MPHSPATSENQVFSVSGIAIARPDEPNHYMLLEACSGRVTAAVGDQVIATSERAFVVREHAGRDLEPVIYFPPEDVRAELLSPAAHRTSCPLKGGASYYDLALEPVLPRAAWRYYETHDFDPRLAELECRVAFDTRVITVVVAARPDGPQSPRPNTAKQTHH